MADVQAEIRDGVLYVQAKLNAERLSSTGKTFLLASGKVRITVDGRMVTVALNAYRPA